MTLIHALMSSSAIKIRTDGLIYHICVCVDWDWLNYYYHYCQLFLLYSTVYWLTFLSLSFSLSRSLSRSLSLYHSLTLFGLVWSLAIILFLNNINFFGINSFSHASMITYVSKKMKHIYFYIIIITYYISILIKINYIIIYNNFWVISNDHNNHNLIKTTFVY